MHEGAACIEDAGGHGAPGLETIAGTRARGKDPVNRGLLERSPARAPRPIRRAVWKDAASAPEKETPGHALMRGGQWQLTERYSSPWRPEPAGRPGAC